jgi:hypothetical protein
VTAIGAEKKLATEGQISFRMGVIKSGNIREPKWKVGAWAGEAGVVKMSL